MSCETTARFMAFATLGVMSTTQELAGTLLSEVAGAEPALVVEETLCLVATATARAAEVALRAQPALAQAVVPTLLHLPYLWRDYLLGTALLEQPEAPASDASGVDEPSYQRLQRKLDFYSVHLPPQQFPGPQALADKMGLWMGRVSPPRLPEMPTARLERLGLTDVLLTHLRLILAYGRKDISPSSALPEQPG
jgi:hypothetical protein